MAEKQIVVFKLGEEEFATEISMVREIVRWQPIRHIPGLPESVEGIVNLRESIVPIIDLKKRFGLSGEKADREHEKIVILKLEDRQIGVLVDDVTEIIRIKDELIEAAPEIISNLINQRYITGVVKHDGRLIIIMDMVQIFSTDEQTELKKVGTE